MMNRPVAAILPRVETRGWNFKKSAYADCGPPHRPFRQAFGYALSSPLPHPSPLVGEGPGVGGSRGRAGARP